MTRKTPTVWVTSWGAATQSAVQLPGAPDGRIRLESAAWGAWLEAPTTRSFAYPIYDEQVGYIRGFMTVRKEQRRRGSDYWVAYRRTGGRLRKIYLGRSDQLTQRHLAATADRFLAMEAPTPQSGLGTGGQKEVMSGQQGGASLGREAMTRRVVYGHQVVGCGRQ